VRLKSTNSLGNEAWPVLRSIKSCKIHNPATSLFVYYYSVNLIAQNELRYVSGHVWDLFLTLYLAWKWSGAVGWVCVYVQRSSI
jgi:hypothetical protein